EESMHLALAVTGAAALTSWRGEKRAADFYDLKGAIEALGATGLEFKRADISQLPLSEQILADGHFIGFAGQVPPSRAREIDVRDAIFIAELDIEKLRAAIPSAHRFHELQKFPSVTRDFALTAPRTL